MNLRTLRPDDLDRVVELTIATFGPFYEESFRSIVGDTVMEIQPGEWQDDYRRQVPGLHDPDAGKHVAVAEVAGVMVGFVAWQADPPKRRGQVDFLVTDAAYRRQGIADELCDHAFAEMKARGVQVVEIGTGGDPFHAPARAFYESRGMTPYTAVFYYTEI